MVLTQGYHTYRIHCDKGVKLKTSVFESFMVEHVWCNGQALAFHLCDLGSIPILAVSCGLSYLLVLALLQGFFSGFSSFPPSTKTKTSKFQFSLDAGPPLITVLATEVVTLLKYQLLLLSLLVDDLINSTSGYVQQSYLIIIE